MRTLIKASLFFFALPALSFNPATKNPLSDFDTLWDNPQYSACNTAAKVAYMSPVEKEVIFILNLARQYPQQFNKTVVGRWPEKMATASLRKSTYYTSLVSTLTQMKPAPLLMPDSILWESAKCHAITSGERNYVGHERQTETCKALRKFFGECCAYGQESALHVVMALLLDIGVPSLGHREICLSSKYTLAAASQKPHQKYGVNTVIDFSYPFGR